MKCIKCGSFAINEGNYDRVRGVDSNLCDVHYWMERATSITELQAQLQQYQWQPIETAPKDGTVILVSRNIESGYEKRVIGTDYFKDGSWWLSRAEMQPTHWMPLHNPPIVVTKE